MADSRGIKDAAKESGKGQNFEQRKVGEAGDAGLLELVVHRALGTDSKAPIEKNVARFQPMTADCGNLSFCSTYCYFLVIFHHPLASIMILPVLTLFFLNFTSVSHPKR